jgi:hypothetical protein
MDMTRTRAPLWALRTSRRRWLLTRQIAPADARKPPQRDTGVLASLVPQPRHRTLIESRFPWSESFDRTFRNEGATGFKSRQLH